MEIIETIILTSKQAENWRVFLSTAIFIGILFLAASALTPTAVRQRNNQFVKYVIFLCAIIAFVTTIYCGFMFSWCIVEKPTGINEYHVVLEDMTPEQLAQKYDIVTYENNYWVVQDK